MEKRASDGPKWGREDLFPTNPDLADILGRTDLNSENFHFFDLLNPKKSGFPGPQISQIWPGPGRAWTLGVGVRCRLLIDCAIWPSRNSPKFISNVVQF